MNNVSFINFNIKNLEIFFHLENRNKKAAILVWNAPRSGTAGGGGGGGGHVVFRGTVVRKYDTFFKGLISLVNPHV